VEGKTRDTKQTSTDNLVVVAPAAGQTPAVDAPAAPAPAAAATPAAQLAPHVVLAASSQDVATGGASSVSLQLHPADLGQVNVTVQLHDGIVSVTVQTHDPAGQAAISASLADLHDALSHHGLHPVEVSLTSLGTTAPSAVAVAASPDASGTNLTGFDAAGQGGANTQDRAQQHSQSAGTQDTDVSGQQDMSGMTARISQPNIPDPSRGLDVRA
jgi:flagellar hook-length control protein FliK